MHPHTSFFLLAALLLGSSLHAEPTAPTKPEQALVLTYFRGNGESGVFLATSDDGHRFTAANGDEPIFTPPQWPKQALTRDPSIVFHQGVFHMVWTSNWEGRVFGYAHSPDLMKWSDPVMVTPFSHTLPAMDQPINVWAPEIHRDPIRDDFFILFSATTPRELGDGDSKVAHTKDHRSYIVRTRDGKSFTSARLFFDPGFSVIDPVMHTDRTNNRWVMALKHELHPNDGGKNLRLVFCPLDLEKPFPPVFTKLSEPILGPGSPIRPHEQVEGPSLVHRDGRWHLYCDAFTSHHYSLITSEDLVTWRDETDQLDMPRNLRHGTVFTAPRGKIGWLAK